MDDTILRLQTELMIREELNVRYAGVLAAKVMYSFDAKAREGVLLWLDNCLPEDFAVGECTVAELMHDVGATPFEALCMMNLFVQHPESAGELMWVETYDSIEVEVALDEQPED